MQQNIPQTNEESDTPVIALSALFWMFFKIACTSFGGFMAIIAVVQNVFVERKKLLPSSDMLDGISLATLLPGPTAVNVVAYVGYRLRGGWGAFVSVIGAVLPPFMIILLLSIAYFQWGEIPVVSNVFKGFIPAVTAIILTTAWHMARQCIVGIREAGIALGAAVILYGVGGWASSLAIIASAGLLGWLWFRNTGLPSADLQANAEQTEQSKVRMRKKNSAHLNSLGDLGFLAVIPMGTADPGLLLKLFSVFSGMSLLLFGGGFVFIPLIGEVVVDSQGWLTQKEFVDGVALGQVMPGPILVSAAFIGYKVAGIAGATVATVGMFGPPAFLMITCTRLMQHVKDSRGVRAVLKGVRPAVIGMIAAAVIIVGKTAAPTLWSGLIFVVTLVMLLRFRIPVVWLIPCAGLTGFLVY